MWIVCLQNICCWLIPKLSLSEHHLPIIYTSPMISQPIVNRLCHCSSMKNAVFLLEAFILPVLSVMRTVYRGGILNLTTLWANVWMQSIFGLVCENIGGCASSLVLYRSHRTKQEHCSWFSHLGPEIPSTWSFSRRNMRCIKTSLLLLSQTMYLARLVKYYSQRFS